jgi:hypothetical protein
LAARHPTKEREVVDELQQYYMLPREDFDLCDPIEWWFGRRALFPNLFLLVRDILTIPGTSFGVHCFFLFLFIFLLVGSAAAVEPIFSGGWATISLRRASLKLETIRTLMILKQRRVWHV